MKRIFLSLLFMAICLFTKAQQSVDPRIQEVYADKTDELVASNPTILNFLTDLLVNRVKIQELSTAGDVSKFAKLSDAKLLNKYNPSLQRDMVFNPETFNPLKYDLEFTSNNSKKIYVVDNTNYIIIIEPQIINH